MARAKTKKGTEQDASLSAPESEVDVTTNGTPIPPEEGIHVGAGEKLFIPREDVDDFTDEGEELDDESLLRKKLRRRLGKQEWFIVNRPTEYTVKLLHRKLDAKGMDEETFYVHPDLRKPFAGELTLNRVFLCYSVLSQRLFLWNVKVSDTSWYESYEGLLSQPATFFAEKEIRVRSDRVRKRYRVYHRPRTCTPTWPEPIDMGELLGEGLGKEFQILDPKHDVYQQHIEGEEL